MESHDDLVLVLGEAREIWLSQHPPPRSKGNIFDTMEDALLRALAAPGHRVQTVRWLADTVGVDVVVRALADTVGPAGLVASMVETGVLAVYDGSQPHVWDTESRPGFRIHRDDCPGLPAPLPDRRAVMTASELVAEVEKVRTALAEVRDRVEELDGEATRAFIANGKALEAASGGLTCVIATLAVGQQEVRRG